MLFGALAAVFLILWAFFAAAMPAIWGVLAKAGNWLAARSMRSGRIRRVVHAGSRFRDYLPVILILCIGGGLAAWTGDEFLDVAEMVHARSATLQQADNTAHDWAIERRNAGATLFFATMTNVGGPIGVGIIALAAFIALLVRHHGNRALYLALTAAGGGGLDWELKRAFARARPAAAEMLRAASGYSFPSGHAMESTVVFTALAYIAVRTFKQWRAKSAVMALGVTMIVSVALSRVYLGVHWISDVGAGVVCGLLWVTVTTVAYEAFRRIRLIRTMRADAQAPAVVSAAAD